VLPPVKAEQDKGAPQTSGISIIIHLGGEVAAFILIKHKLIAAGGVFENKVLYLFEGRVFECNRSAT